MIDIFVTPIIKRRRVTQPDLQNVTYVDTLLIHTVHYTITNELYMKQVKCLVKYVAKFLTIL